VLKERTHLINNKMKLYIPGVPMNKLGNWLICPKKTHNAIQCSEELYKKESCRRNTYKNMLNHTEKYI